MMSSAPRTLRRAAFPNSSLISSAFSTSFIKANPSQRDMLARCFVSLVDGSRSGDTSWIVRFCMRDLRWPEVREAANRRFSLARGAEVPRLMNWLSDINWVYDDAPWEDADFFQYFWNKEHPGEPWPCLV